MLPDERHPGATDCMADLLRRLFRRLGFIRFIFPKPIRKHIAARLIQDLPSRQYLLQTLLPALAAAGCQRMLFVGAQAYNLPFYRRCADFHMDIWSIDFDPLSAKYGAPAGHFVGDIREVDKLVGPLRFDVIMFNGIFGFGVNKAEAALAALRSMAKTAEPEALFIVGWNPGLTNDQEMAAIRPHVMPASLADLPVIEFPRVGRLQRHPHRYEVFKFSADAAAAAR